jgi:hypothetical protein
MGVELRGGPEGPGDFAFEPPERENFLPSWPTIGKVIEHVEDACDPVFLDVLAGLAGAPGRPAAVTADAAKGSARTATGARWR